MIDTKELALRNFLEDPILKEKYNLREDEIKDIKLWSSSDHKIIEVIRIILSNYDNETNLKRLLNNYLRV